MISIKRGSRIHSSQYPFNYLRGFDASEPVIESLEFLSETLVVDAESIEKGCVKVADVDGVFDSGIAKFVGSAVDVAGLNARAGHPNREGLDVVVTTGTLAHWSASKLTSPNHQGVLQHTALL